MRCVASPAQPGTATAARAWHDHRRANGVSGKKGEPSSFDFRRVLSSMMLRGVDVIR
jgi:hypothetical protein